MLHHLQTLLALSYVPTPPHPPDDSPSRPTDNTGTPPNSEAGPPMGAFSNSMLMTSNDPTLPRLLSDYALISSGSGGSLLFSNGPSENPFALDLSADQTPLSIDQLSPATTDSGDVAEPTQIVWTSPQSHGHYQPLDSSDGAWQGPALPSEYSPPNAWLWETTGYSQPTGIDMLTPPFALESQPLPDALSLDVNVSPQAKVFHLPPPASLSPQYQCFIDLEGVRWYQCVVCGKCTSSVSWSPLLNGSVLIAALFIGRHQATSVQLPRPFRDPRPPSCAVQV